MALTFKTLCTYADWTKIPTHKKKETESEKETPNNSTKESSQTIIQETKNEEPSKLNLLYNIQIHLPETRDMAVYDAIFQSLKKHLY